MTTPITLNYDAFGDELKLALAGKQPGDECVLTLRVKVTSNSDESIDFDAEEVTLDKEASPEPEEVVEEDEVVDDDAPAIVVAMAKKKM